MRITVIARILAMAAAALTLASAPVSAAAHADACELAYAAIRNNDLPALRAFANEDVNRTDGHGATALMYAATLGSPEALQILLDAGAAVDAQDDLGVTALMRAAGNPAKARMLISAGAGVDVRSRFGRTALTVAAMHDGSHEVVRALLQRHAAVNVADNMKVTPLIAAAFGNDTETVRLLVAAGADVNAHDAAGFTPVMRAAANGNAETVKLLLAKGADVNAVTARATDPPMKNGPIALGNFTALLLAAPMGGPEVVKMLLQAGADVNARDVRGMTPLMLAIATDRVSVQTVKLLLDHGADKSDRSAAGETAADWARKFRNPAVVRALGVAVERQSAESTTARPTAVTDAVRTSLALLQKTSGRFANAGGCVGCHAQGLTSFAVRAARESGFATDEQASAQDARAVKGQLMFFSRMLTQRVDPPAVPDTLEFALLQMHNQGVEPDRMTDLAVTTIANAQTAAGNWHLAGIARPPMEDGDFTRTALAIRMLQVYGPPALAPEYRVRIERAAEWLKTHTPRTAEDRNMQLLGLKWAGAPANITAPLAGKILAAQLADGGWAQTPYLPSDAYATGQTLYVLHEVGVHATASTYTRGAAYLLRTRQPDGSWHVRSRAPKLQPYFESGFAHGQDQWISQSGTAWATAALSYTAATDVVAVNSR